MKILAASELRRPDVNQTVFGPQPSSVARGGHEQAICNSFVQIFQSCMQDILCESFALLAPARSWHCAESNSIQRSMQLGSFFNATSCFLLSVM